MKLNKFDSINVIPFIDVLLVLLAIVLMTSTFITKGIIPISLPKADTYNDIKEQKQQKILIKNNGNFYYNNIVQSVSEISSKILTFPKTVPIHIKSDKDAEMQSFVTIIDMLKKNGYSNISIVIEK